MCDVVLNRGYIIIYTRGCWSNTIMLQFFKGFLLKHVKIKETTLLLSVYDNDGFIFKHKCIDRLIVIKNRYVCDVEMKVI